MTVEIVKGTKGNRIRVMIEADDDTTPQWGKSPTGQGKVRIPGVSRNAYIEHAVAFVVQYPIGTVLTREAFDQWLLDRGLIPRLPPDGIDKDSDAWLGHIQRRHQHRERLNKAATHSRMFQEWNSVSYMIVTTANGYEICAPQIAAERIQLPHHLETITETMRKKLAALMQSTDWQSLPSDMRDMASEVYEDILALKDDTKVGAMRIENRMGRWQKRLSRRIAAGQISDSRAVRDVLNHEVTVVSEDETSVIEEQAAPLDAQIH